ncbi:MAG TPA: HAMP domain-containing protein, partial [Candidatus Methylomirabilis sp.]|nr:HAMP domain-containing protein [Candidatus Methylomirabilis sp.]
LRQIRLLRADLTRHLEGFRRIHRAEWESAKDDREPVLLAKLQEYAGEIGAIVDRFATALPPARLLTARDLNRLRVISHEALIRVEELRDTHRIGITRILQGSQDKTWIIIILYLALLLFGGTLIAVASVTIRRRIVLPLRALSDAALGIAEGRLGKRVPVRSSDEIGQLSHAFNVMVDQLQTRERDLRDVQGQLEQKVREINALYRIGTEISDLHHVDRILQSLVEKTRELLKSDVSILCTLSQHNGVSAMATSGPPDAFVNSRCPSPCVCVTGGDSATLDRPCHLIRPEYLQAYLAARIRRGEEVLGVLHACRRDPRAFGRDEAELLTGLAAQAAIAIENARLYKNGQSLAALQERERIAREMHDGLAQALGLLHLKLSRAHEAMVEGNLARIADTLSEMKGITHETYDDVRQSIFGLRTMVSHGLGLIPSLTEFLHEFSDQNGIAVEFDVIDSQPIHLSPASEVQLIRIIQEALANVRKHSGAERAWVRFQRQVPWIQVTIEDNGRGCAPAILTSLDRHHFGLQSMRERAEGLGGKLEIDTGPGRGMRVVATLPEEA